MIPTMFHGFFQLIRFAFNFGAPKKETKHFNEICRQLEVLQLDFSNAEAVSDACVYLADPHKLPGPTKDSSDNASKIESNADNEKPQFHYKRSDEKNQSSKQYQVNDMSISSGSNFEETLLNHFQHTPKPKSKEKLEKSYNSSIDFASSLKYRHMNGTIPRLSALTETSKSHTSAGEENLSLRNVTETVSTSNIRNTSAGEENFSLRNVTETVSIGNSKSPSGEGKNQRIINNHFDESSSPVQHFCCTSLVASTPLCVKPGSESRHRMTMMNSAVKTKVRKVEQQILLNLSTGSNDSMNTVDSKDETPKREQGAIAKHIARIRTANSTLNSSKKTFNNTSRYYSMRTSFGSNSSTSFS
ncbi:unnamed protein product [Cercopithifilaria johnstoni]|uniref:Uncharacterized protein n=1 Tax=Cercopithifilaria johnstoni TaxID=2874296 RepID=A0A8J2Q362_9BILA|nr:unnamed protein product [Cercopithifilaria johnstoni]